MNHKTLLLTCLLLTTITIGANEQNDTTFNNLYRRYFELYADSDETAFYKASEQLKNYYLEHSKSDSYYKIRLNEILYDTKQGKSYRAIKKASTMLQEMEQGKEKHYEIIYSALGNIYESRGNYRLSERYYNEALKACAPKDTGSLMSIYSRMALLKAKRAPKEAWKLNEHFGAMSRNNPNYYKVYVVLKVEISFYLNDKGKFEQAYREFNNFNKQHPDFDGYGDDMISTVFAAFNGQYDEALKILSQESPDFNVLERCDMRITLYEMMGNQNKAIAETEHLRDIRDSLNSDMLFESINEINSELGLDRLAVQARLDRERANQRQMVLMGVVIILLLAALGLLISRYLMRRKMQKQLMNQNKELEIALSRAEESDRMKDSFIEHVSHEIRTPLNVITGYAQIITNPEYQLSDEERNHMLRDISKNTTEITYIVNELLEVAEDESRQHYQKTDIIAVNKLCEKLIANAEIKNAGRLKISFESNLHSSFTMQSNRRAMEKVLQQLLNNAMKFTEEGSIELQVRLTEDEHNIQFIVSDTGIGIAEENQNRVFERFFKVDTFKQGFGLGLTLCRKMAILLDGNLFLDKQYTNGARFILTLPLANK